MYTVETLQLQIEKLAHVAAAYGWSIERRRRPDSGVAWRDAKMVLPSKDSKKIGVAVKLYRLDPRGKADIQTLTVYCLTEFADKGGFVIVVGNESEVDERLAELKEFLAKPFCSDNSEKPTKEQSTISQRTPNDPGHPHPLHVRRLPHCL
jgi:hypothetical protein